MEKDKQIELEFGTAPHKLVRRGDPDTSHDAAYAVNSGKLERLVYNCIHDFGYHGCISDDVRMILKDLPYSSVTARFRALLDRNLIEDTGERRQGLSGRSQRVVRATNKHFRFGG